MSELPLAAASRRLKHQPAAPMSTYQRHRAAGCCGRCGRASRTAYCSACRQRFAARLRLKHAGVSDALYAAALLKQGARCAICQTHQAKTRKALHADHDHRSGVFRGLLCNRCNLGLGHFLDQPRRLLAAVEYLLGCLEAAVDAPKRAHGEQPDV